jgi:hypothetical protein
MAMLTQREILNELRRLGIKEPSLLKAYFEEFEHYMEINYGLRVAKANEKLEDVPDLDSPPRRRQHH